MGDGSAPARKLGLVAGTASLWPVSALPRWPGTTLGRSPKQAQQPGAAVKTMSTAWGEASMADADDAGVSLLAILFQFNPLLLISPFVSDLSQSTANTETPCASSLLA